MEFDYIETRLKGQMEYYHTKCISLRKEYYIISIIAIVINAAIPVLTISIEVNSIFKYVIASLSAIASILSSALLLRKTKDTWIEYRNTYEKLKREKVLFENQCDKYSNGNVHDFIMVCEDIMQNEHSAWKELINTAGKK